MLQSEKSAPSGYQRNLLSATTSVRVTLAGRKQSLASLLALVPGSIVPLETCFDEPLSLSIGDRVIGSVDAVKIGDKFGVQIREMRASKAE